MHRNLVRQLPRFAFALLIAGAGGCGPGQHDVTGQVKYNGAPLKIPGGQIVFVGPDGTQAPAPINEDGTYSASKVLAGRNRVAVYYPNPKAQTGRRRPTKGQPPPGPSEPEPPFLTPEKYASADGSGLSVDVAEGTVFNADLTGPPIPTPSRP
jgi:hypothetical protein